MHNSRRWSAACAKLLSNLACCLCCLLLSRGGAARSPDGSPPLPMNDLKKALSLVRGEAQTNSWPRTIPYTFKVYDFKTDAFRRKKKRSPWRSSPCA